MQIVDPHSLITDFCSVILLRLVSFLIDFDAERLFHHVPKQNDVFF
jgi:hypothetical protein